MSLHQPVGFVKLTNVAFIKYKIDNKKFEVVCYKNKALNWRNDVVTDIAEVLQTEEIFTNATHGQAASKEDLAKYFPKMKKEDIIKLILEKGDLQVSEKEREVHMQNLLNDVIKVVAEKCVHPDSQRSFSIEDIRQAVKDVQFIVRPDKPAKAQALVCIKLLAQKYFIERAKMKVRVTFSPEDKSGVLEQLLALHMGVLEDKEHEIVSLIDPSEFRSLFDVIKKKYQNASIEVLENNISNKEQENINEVGKVELRVREEWLAQQKSEQQAKDKSAKKKKPNADLAEEAPAELDEEVKSDQNDAGGKATKPKSSLMGGLKHMIAKRPAKK